MSTKNEGIEKKKVVTPVFRASYANVFEPTAVEEDSEKKYNITMLFEKDEDLKEMRKAATNAAIEKWGKDPAKWKKLKLRFPFRDGSEKEDNEEYEGKIFVYASSKKRIPVLQRKKDKKTGKFLSIEPEWGPDEGGFYSGCMARATLIAFAYDTAGNRGVSFALMGLQKWEDAEPLGGGSRAQEDFDDGNDAEDSEEDIDVTDSDEEEYDLG